MGGLLTIQDRTLAVVTGAEARCACRVRNTGAIVDQFALQVLGPAGAWTVADPPLLSLFPGTDGEIVLRLRPPAGQPAGAVCFGVRLVCSADPSATVVEEATIEVGPSVSVTARLLPRTARGRGAGRHRLILTNTGNAGTMVRVSGSDPDNLIRFRALGRAPIGLAAGARGEIGIRYRSTARHLRGPAESHPFTLSVVPDGGEAVAVEGTFTQRAAISGWMMALVVGAVAILAIALVARSLAGAGGVKQAALANAPVALTSTPSPSAGASASAPTAAASPTAGASPSPSPGSARGSDGGPAGGGQSGGTGANGGTGPRGAAATPAPPLPLAPAPLTFSHFDGSTTSIHVLAAGTDRAIVANASSPAWSPSGTSLAYITAAGNVDVGTYDLTSGTFSPGGDRVASVCGCLDPSWSPDGTSIAYVNRNGDLQIIGAAGGSPVTLVPGVHPTAVTWTPNATDVVYGTASGVLHVSRFGGSPQQIVTAANVDGVSFRADGTMITWSAGPNLTTRSVYSASISPQLAVSGTTTVASTGHFAHFGRAQNLVYFAAPNGSGEDDIFAAAPAGGPPTDTTPSSSAASAAVAPHTGCYPAPFYYCYYILGQAAHFNAQPEG